MDRCWAFTHAFNEELMIRFWARHYRTFCERLIVYVDSDTDDGTAEIAEEEGAETRPFTSGGLDDMGFVAFAQEKYKEARGQAEWFVWTDADEFLHHPVIDVALDLLSDAGVNYPHVEGYSMLAGAPPKGAGQIYDELCMGIPSPEYAKPCIFDPALDIVWGAGKHDVLAIGGVAVRPTSQDPLKLLHYRYLGAEWHLARNQRNYARMNPAQRGSLGLEVHPDYTGPYSPGWYAQQMAAAREVLS